MDPDVKRGEIYYADLSPVVGSEQGGVRPVLIVQNNVGNRYSPTVIAAAITSQTGKARLPTHIELSAKSYGLSKDSVILLEQIRTIDKKRLKEKMGSLDDTAMHRVDEALVVSFGLIENQGSEMEVPKLKNRKWKVTLGILLLSIILAAGYFALAAEYGSQEDPLVTLSYITDVVSPGTLAKVDEEIAAKMAEFQSQLDAKMTEFESQIDSKISSGGSSTGVIDDELVDAVANAVLEKLKESGTGSADWQLIDFPNGKTITMSIGAEVLLRIGSATVVSSGTTGLINLTSATVINNGAELEKNCLYMVTIEGRGIKATADCKILIRGNYSMN